MARSLCRHVRLDRVENPRILGFAKPFLFVPGENFNTK